MFCCQSHNQRDLKAKGGAGELLRVLTAVSEDWNLFPSTSIAFKSNSKGCISLF